VALVPDNLLVSFQAVKKFCDSHDLKINSDKTQLILFKKLGKPIPDDFHLTLDNCVIKPEKTVKLLGVTLDQHLSLGPHIDNVVNKCQGLLGILAKGTPYLPKDLLYTDSSYRITYRVLLLYLFFTSKDTSKET